MNSFIDSEFFILGLTSVFVVVDSEGLTAVSFGNHIEFLYQELRNEDAPSQTDPATSDANVRELICDSIIGSGFLQLFGFFPVNLLTHGEKSDPLYSYIFNRMYDSSNVYTNSYRLRHFNGEGSDFNEYVFLCAAWNKQKILPYYISKEYNVGSFSDELRMPGRFIFGSLVPNSNHLYFTMLAEEPAIAYVRPGFDVELDYIRIRKYIEPADSDDVDPLCKHVTKENVRNHYYRFCVAVARSLHFVDKIRYPTIGATHDCRKREVSFRTPRAMAQAAEKLFFERMMPCPCVELEPRKEKGFFYISRGYKSNGVFVYYQDLSDEKIYLENLSTNISIVDELNSFDFLED